MFLQKGAFVSILQSLTEWLRARPFMLVFILIYFLGLFFSRILPEALVFTGLGYFAVPKLLDSNLIAELLKSSHIYLAAVFAFFIGLRLPWHKVNLIRTRLYNTTIVSVTFIILFFLLFYVLLGEVKLEFINEQTKNIFLLFLFLILFISGYQIKAVVQKHKASGPLALGAVSTAYIISALAIFFLELFKGFRSSLGYLDLFWYVFFPLCYAVLILLVLSGLRIFCKIKSGSLEFKFVLIGVFAGLAGQIHGSFILLALFSGVGLAIFQEDFAEEFSEVDFSGILSNILILCFAPFLLINKEVLCWVLGYFILKNIFYRLSFFSFGRLFNYNETVYKNLGAALLIPDGLPLLFLFAFAEQQFINKPLFDLGVSIFLLTYCLEYLLFKFIFPRTLRAAGEIVNSETMV